MGKKNKTIWLKKRRKARLSQYEVVKELVKYEPSINVELYDEIERGHREMPSGLVDIFNKITGKKEENKLETMIKERDLDLWFENNDVVAIMTDFGYTQKEVADKLGLSVTTVWSMVTGKRGTSREAKEKVYDFLHNSLNRKTDEEKSQKRHYKKRKTKEEKLEELQATFGTIDVSVNNNTGVSFTNEELDNAIKYTNQEQEKSFTQYIEEKVENKENEKEYNCGCSYDREDTTKETSCEMTTDDYNISKSLELVKKLEKVLEDNDKDLIIEKQKQEIEELKIKIARYEKIIDRL